MSNLIPALRQKFFTTNGLPLAGGFLYSYQAGTTTPLATYVDSTGLTPNTNPIVLDSNGECNLWIANNAYKFQLTDSLGVVQWTVDNVLAVSVVSTPSGITSLTGDVVASGVGAITTAIQPGVVTNNKLATMATSTIKGNVSGSTASPSDLTATQATTILNAFIGDSGLGGTKGLVPAPSSGDAPKFLRADGTWTTPAGGGTVTSTSVVSANGFAGTVANPTTTPAITLTTSITGLLKGNGTAISAAGSSDLPTIALTSDVTGSASGGSIATTIAASAVTNSKMANMNTLTIKGNNTGISAAPIDLTATQTTAILNAMVGDSGSGGTKGLVPAPSAGDAAASKYLKADGTWATTPSGFANPMTSGGDIIYGGTSGAPTRLANGTAGQYLTSQGTTLAPIWSGGVPTVQRFTSTGTTSGQLFTISTSSTVSIGDVYADSGAHNFTVLAALTAQSGQVLFCSGTTTTPSGSTLTKQSGNAGSTTSITFTAALPLATYTRPTPAPIYIRPLVIGAGGGGAGGGTSAGTAAGAGLSSVFGTNLILAGGGTAGLYNSTPAAGGVGTVNSPALAAKNFTGGTGGGCFNNAASIAFISGSPGGSNPAGGGGPLSGPQSTGTAALANTGGGGGGGGAANTANSGSGGGGGAGAYIEAIINSPAATYFFAVGTGGTAGGAGAGVGGAGGVGGTGLLVIEEHYL